MQGATAAEVAEHASPLLNAGLHGAVTARCIAWGLSSHLTARLAPSRVFAVNSLLSGLLSAAAATLGDGVPTAVCLCMWDAPVVVRIEALSRFLAWSIFGSVPPSSFSVAKRLWAAVVVIQSLRRAETLP